VFAGTVVGCGSSAGGQAGSACLFCELEVLGDSFFIIQPFVLSFEKLLPDLLGLFFVWASAVG
jgi:hypothetical protein